MFVVLLMLLLGSLIVEYGLTTLRTRLRFAVGCLLVLIIIVSTLGVLAIAPNAATGILTVMSAYRCLNILRLLRGRLQPLYARHATRRAAAWLGMAQFLMVLAWAAFYVLVLDGTVLWWLLGIWWVGASMVLLASTVRSIYKTGQLVAAGEPAIASWPSLTVAIPARNETQDLEACLTSLIASDYPKLEILVLDDCSQNKRTPEIIRAFAHTGVRFLQGLPPSDSWLAKNYAYQQLLDAASGELILFCGVDVRLQPQALRALVQLMIDRHKQMVSVLPVDTGPRSLIQPMRYAWELVLPRRLFRRPPALSACWMARRAMLLQAGGFAAARHLILPEKYFAERAIGLADGYSFVRSGAEIMITSVKSIAAQRATAVRTWYPKLHRRLELVPLVTAAELFTNVAPFVVLVAAFFAPVPRAMVAAAAIAAITLSAVHTMVHLLTYRRWVPGVFFLLVPATIVDSVLLHVSLIDYEFSEVLWKGRNVCLPVNRYEIQA